MSDEDSDNPFEDFSGQARTSGRVRAESVDIDDPAVEMHDMHDSNPFSGSHPDAPQVMTPPASKAVERRQKYGNIASFILCIIFNALASTGALTGRAVGDVSAEFNTFITPASFAFSIWIPIYVLMGCFVIWQTRPQNSGRTLLWSSYTNSGIGYWFIAVNFANMFWLILFTIDNVATTWLSCLVIIALLVFLVKIYENLHLWQPRNSQTGSGLPVWTEFFLLEVNFSLYAGWITVATIVNTSAALVASGSCRAATDALMFVSYVEGWDKQVRTAAAFSIFMQVIALGVVGVIAIRKKDYVWPLVLCWALFAISQGDLITADAELAKANSLAVNVTADVDLVEKAQATVQTAASMLGALAFITVVVAVVLRRRNQ